MRVIFSGIVIALTLAGCVSTRNDAALAEQAAIVDGCRAASAGPEAAVIASKTFTTQVTEITPEMLSDPNAPTPQEADALRTLDARRSLCRQQLVAWTAKYQPRQAPNLQEQFYREDLALGDLIQRKTSYGDANRRIYEAYLEAMKVYNSERQAEIRAAEAEQDRRIALTRAMFVDQPAPVAPMPTQAAAPTPRTKNCISNVIGTTVYTNCY